MKFVPRNAHIVGLLCALQHHEVERTRLGDCKRAFNTATSDIASEFLEANFDTQITILMIDIFAVALGA